MPVTKEELQARAQLVRIHEANCQVEHPSDEERAFRLAIMKKLGAEYGLKELRTLTYGPVARPATAPAATAKK